MQIRPAILKDATRIASVHVDSERAAYRGILPDSVLDSLPIELTLWVFELNYRARQFYEKVDFTLDREIQKTVVRGARMLTVVRYRRTL